MGGRGTSSGGSVKNSLGREVKKLNSAPAGWKPIKNATTAPKGYTWYSNGESRFGGKRQEALIRDRRK